MIEVRAQLLARLLLPEALHSLASAATPSSTSPPPPSPTQLKVGTSLFSASSISLGPSGSRAQGGNSNVTEPSLPTQVSRQRPPTPFLAGSPSAPLGSAPTPDCAVSDRAALVSPAKQVVSGSWRPACTTAPDTPLHTAAAACLPSVDDQLQ